MKERKRCRDVLDWTLPLYLSTYLCLSLMPLSLYIYIYLSLSISLSLPLSLSLSGPEWNDRLPRICCDDVIPLESLESCAGRSQILIGGSLRREWERKMKEDNHWFACVVINIERHFVNKVRGRERKRKEKGKGKGMREGEGGRGREKERRRATWRIVLKVVDEHER